MRFFIITILALILSGLLLGLAPPTRAGMVSDPFTGAPLRLSGLLCN